LFISKLTIRYGILALLSLGISGCVPIALTAAALGASVGVNHTLSGVVYKTFTAPINSVETSTVRAMKDMGIKVVSSEPNEKGERVILGAANKREIVVRLEPLTKRTTQIRVTASEGILKDSATAFEIVLQTERVLSGG